MITNLRWHPEVACLLLPRGLPHADLFPDNSLESSRFRQAAIVIFYLTGELDASNLPGGDWAVEMEARHWTQVGERISKYSETQKTRGQQQGLWPQDNNSSIAVTQACNRYSTGRLVQILHSDSKRGLRTPRKVRPHFLEFLSVSSFGDLGYLQPYPSCWNTASQQQDKSCSELHWLDKGNSERVWGI